MKFYNRKEEIEILNKIEKNLRIAIIGRRRIGKTTLIEHSYKEKCITFFVSAEKAEKEIISDWVREYPALHLPAVSSFKEFFEFIFVHLKEKIVFIDELQNLLKVNKSFFFDLQRIIDKYKPNLVVSGSLISMMKKIIEDEKSPLYGRFDFIIKVRELSFKTICEICCDFNLDIEKAFALYSIFGGIPKYYELIEKLHHFDTDNFVFELFIRYPRPLYEEVKTILKEEFGKEYKTFFTILSAISQGKNKNSEIAGYLGKKGTEITKYLSMLKEDFELIERNTPLVGGKKGIYSIKNNLFLFWFNNIWKYNQLLETGQENKAEEKVRQNLKAYTGKMFEKTIRELFIQNTFSGFSFTKIGRQWGKIKNREEGKNTYEIDILALNEESREILFAECKWQNNVDAEEILKQLIEKSKFVEWNNESRKEQFAIFAKSFKKKIKEFEGKKVYCFDIRDIKRAL